MKLSRLALFSMVTVAISAPSSAADFWSTPASVVQIYPHDGGLTFVTDYSNVLSTCGGTRWVLPIAGPNYKVAAAALMLAFAQGQKIQFHVNDQPATCEPAVDRFTASR